MRHKDSYTPGRMSEVQTPIIPVVAELIAENPGTVSLGQGVVYYGPPPAVYEQLKRIGPDVSLHKYGDTSGLAELRQTLAEKLLAENGIETDGCSKVMVTAGSNMAFLNAVLAITSPGDEIILPVPYYFNHEMAIRMSGCTPVCVACGPDHQPDPASLRTAITAKTRAIVTISPNNPSGAVYPQSVLTSINTLCREHGIYHISDEAYEYFVYDNARHFSPASLPGAAEYTISLYSLSKAYGFAHWRIGYMVIPDHLHEAVLKVQDTNLICPPVASQYAALGALSAGSAWCRDKLGLLHDIRTIMLSGLQSISNICSVSKSEGAFYFLLKLATDLDDMTVLRRLIREYQVAAIPGGTFGLMDGCYLRVSYGALDKNNAAEGIRRLTHGLNSIIKNK